MLEFELLSMADSSQDYKSPRSSPPITHTSDTELAATSSPSSTHIFTFSLLQKYHCIQYTYFLKQISKQKPTATLSPTPTPRPQFSKFHLLAGPSGTSRATTTSPKPLVTPLGTKSFLQIHLSLHASLPSPLVVHSPRTATAPRLQLAGLFNR